MGKSHDNQNFLTSTKILKDASDFSKNNTAMPYLYKDGKLLNGSLESYILPPCRTLTRLEPGILEVCDGAKDSRRPVQCTREGPKRSKQALSRLAPGILEVCEGAKDSSRPVQCTREIP